jgi:hypothetical protein
MKKIFLLLLLLCSNTFAQTNYNSIATAYVTTTISQSVVFDSAMQTGGTFTFSVLAHNGGGRAGQSDTANVKIQFYTSSGTLVASVNSNYNANLPNPNAVCGNPCIDTAVPWTTLTTSTTLTQAQASTVAYAKVSMYGIDGSYWAGDYGPWYRAPTLQRNNGGNLLYNPEFGPAYGYNAQGWTTNPGMGSCQGAWGGSNPCIVNSDGVPGSSTVGLVANENGGGPSASGGTTSGTPGGYNSTMSVTNSGTGTTAGTPTTPPAPTLCCGGSSAAFNADTVNAAKVQTFASRTTNDSRVYIEQIGNMNSITVQQSGTKNNYAGYTGNGSSNDIDIVQSGNASTQVNYANVNVTGNSNTVSVTQSSTGGAKGAFVNIQNNNNSVLIQQKDSGSHWADITLSGGNKNVDILQQGSGGHMTKINLSGLAQDLSLTQSGSTQQYYSITSNCATAGGCVKITVNQGQ